MSHRALKVRILFTLPCIKDEGSRVSNNQIESFYQEYTSENAVRRYSKATAGAGISYLLDHDYKKIYMEAMQSIPDDVRKDGIRILEFGCGVGMNLIHLVSALSHEGIKIKEAVGTDFSPVLIEAARREAAEYLSKDDASDIRFFVGSNETLVADLGKDLGLSEHELMGRFDFILGVNTMRYCHRAEKELDCAKDIFHLLTPGGVCVSIDMNDRFLFFRSSLRRGLAKQKRKGDEAYLPSIDEYASPFLESGFELLRKEHFCWVPHSAGRLTSRIFGVISPVLNSVAKSRAMRSLIVTRKPMT